MTQKIAHNAHYHYLLVRTLQKKTLKPLLNLPYTTMKIFILCAGNASRFTGIQKQLLPIGETTILGRQLSFLRDYDVYVVTHHDEIADYARVFGANIINPESHTNICDSAYSTYSEWCETNVILLGDVIYSKVVMNQILLCREPMKFFGNVYEIFALTFTNIEIAERALRLGIKTPYGKLCHAYRSFIGAPIDRQETPKLLRSETYFQYIDCRITRDCDTTNQYLNIVNELVNRNILDLQ